MVGGIDEKRRERLEQLLESDFRAQPVELDRLAPEPARNGGLPVYGYVDGSRDADAAARARVGGAS